MAFIGMDHGTTGISFCIMSDDGEVIDVFKIGREESKQGLVSATEELKKRVDSGEMVVAFALYPVTMRQIIDIADTGNIMPPKTTWFEPKLRSGLVIHKLS